MARRVPLTASGRVRGTFVEVGVHKRAGQLLYHNAWFTDLDVQAANVAQIVGMGRSRWKIENEQFKALIIASATLEPALWTPRGGRQIDRVQNRRK